MGVSKALQGISGKDTQPTAVVGNFAGPLKVLVQQQLDVGIITFRVVILR